MPVCHLSSHIISISRPWCVVGTNWLWISLRNSIRRNGLFQTWGTQNHYQAVHEDALPALVRIGKDSKSPWGNNCLMKIFQKHGPEWAWIMSAPHYWGQFTWRPSRELYFIFISRTFQMGGHCDKRTSPLKFKNMGTIWRECGNFFLFQRGVVLYLHILPRK